MEGNKVSVQQGSFTARVKAEAGDTLGIVISIVTPQGVLRIVPEFSRTVNGLIARLEAEVKPGEKEPTVALHGVAVEPA